MITQILFRMDSHAKHLILHYLEKYPEPKFEVIRVLLEPHLQPRITRKNWKKQIWKLLSENHQLVAEEIDIKQETP